MTRDNTYQVFVSQPAPGNISRIYRMLMDQDDWATATDGLLAAHEGHIVSPAFHDYHPHTTWHLAWGHGNKELVWVTSLSEMSTDLTLFVQGLIDNLARTGVTLPRTEQTVRHHLSTWPQRYQRAHGQRPNREIWKDL